MSDAVERLTNWLAMTETVLGNPPIADAVREVLAEVERLREVLKGQPVIKSEWEKLVEENERLRAEAKAQGTQDFTDVLHRATFAEAKINAALKIYKNAPYDPRQERAEAMAEALEATNE
jgi:hypothetical protein